MSKEFLSFKGEELSTLISELEWLVKIQERITSLDVWHDPMDNALKFKVNGAVWSRPFSGTKVKREF